MRYAETHRLLGSVLVGVCHTDLGDPRRARERLLPRPVATGSAITRQPGSGSGSSTPPTIRSSRCAEARFVAAQLRCSYFEHQDRGHFVDSHDLPEVLEFVRRKLHLS